MLRSTWACAYPPVLEAAGEGVADHLERDEVEGVSLLKREILPERGLPEPPPRPGGRRR